jgi:hypothetical protein
MTYQLAEVLDRGDLGAEVYPALGLEQCALETRHLLARVDMHPIMPVQLLRLPTCSPSTNMAQLVLRRPTWKPVCYIVMCRYEVRSSLLFSVKAL